jgi:hypothetical protein
MTRHFHDVLSSICSIFCFHDARSLRVGLIGLKKTRRAGLRRVFRLGGFTCGHVARPLQNAKISRLIGFALNVACALKALQMLKRPGFRISAACVRDLALSRSERVFCDKRIDELQNF